MARYDDINGFNTKDVDDRKKLEDRVAKLESILKALVGDLVMYSNLPIYIRNSIQEELTNEDQS